MTIEKFLKEFEKKAKGKHWTLLPRLNKNSMIRCGGMCPISFMGDLPAFFHNVEAQRIGLSNYDSVDIISAADCSFDEIDRCHTSEVRLLRERLLEITNLKENSCE